MTPPDPNDADPSAGDPPAGAAGGPGGRPGPPRPRRRSAFLDVDDDEAEIEVAPAPAPAPVADADADADADAEAATASPNEPEPEAEFEPELEAEPDPGPPPAAAVIPSADLPPPGARGARTAAGAATGGTLIPWLLSVGAHLAVLPPAVFLAWSVRTLTEDVEKVVPVVNLAPQPSEVLEARPVELPTPEAVVTPAAAPEPVPVTEPDDAALLPDAALPGLGDPAALAPSFDLPVGETSDTAVRFMGSGGNARDIVFVLEADGSIVSDYPEIVNNLARTLREMNERQRYSVVVFDGSGAKEVPPAGLKNASAREKAATIRWLRDTANVQNSGSGDVVPALTRAARLGPQLIFLLSQNLYNPGRGPYERQREDILEAVRRLPTRATAINAIEFNQVDPLAGPNGASLMKQIADLTDGKYNFVVTNVEPEL